MYLNQQAYGITKNYLAALMTCYSACVVGNLFMKKLTPIQLKKTERTDKKVVGPVIHRVEAHNLTFKTVIPLWH